MLHLINRTGITIVLLLNADHWITFDPIPPVLTARITKRSGEKYRITHNKKGYELRVVTARLENPTELPRRKNEGYIVTESVARAEAERGRYHDIFYIPDPLPKNGEEYLTRVLWQIQKP